jgi:hypothetical protein
MNETIGGLADQDPVTLQAAVSGALATVFRGKFCDIVLPNRRAATFTKNAVIYDVGDADRTFSSFRAASSKLEQLPRMGTR